MRRNRNRFRRRARARGRRLRGTTILFQHSACLEALELRAMLSGTPADDSALLAGEDVYSSPLDEISVAQLCASALGGCGCDTADGDVPDAAPLSATSDNSDGEPIVQPLLSGQAVQTLVRVEDLNGNEISSVKVGQEFKLFITVDDIRTSTAQGQDLFGVFSPYVRATYDAGLVSYVNGTLSVDNFFSDFDVRTDTSASGVIRAGGSTLQFTFGDPPQIGTPGSDPQLLWTATFRANGAGTFSFDTFFEDFADDPPAPDWLMYGDSDNVTAQNFLGNSFNLTVVGPDISISDVTQIEGDTDSGFVFTLSLAQASSQPVTVAYATQDGTATAGADYTAQSGTVTFAAGVTQQTITVNVVGDNDQEPDENFSVVLSNASGGVIADGTGVATIQDDDLTRIGISDVSMLETDGQTTMVFTVTISSAVSSNVLVPFSTSNGTATAGDDYQATSGTLTFAAGSTDPQFITVIINGDETAEPNEDFQVVLTQPTNAEFDESNGTATGTLLNDDGPYISFVQNAIAQSENSTQFVFTVTIHEPGSGNVTVAYTTANGTAIAGSDYTATSGTLTFSGATITQDITVTVNNDELNEPDETFTVQLSSPSGATLAETTATATIENDDPLPTIQSIASVSETEGVAIVFTVNLSAPSGQMITAQYETSDGTATAGSDYQAGSGTITFMPGETQKLITVIVDTDALNEPNEDFQLRLFDATNVTNTTDLTATGTIENDDPLPTLTITPPANTNEGTSSGNKQFIYTVSLSAASGQQVRVNWSTANGTATAGSDYVAASGTLTFAPGTVNRTITVSVVSDSTIEPSETFLINLFNPVNVDLSQTSFEQVITNDDGLPTLSINNPAAQNEGDEGATPFEFTVTLSQASNETVTVAYATVDGIASVADNDYQATSGTLTFQPGQTTQTITVLVNGDTRVESVNESFSVQLSNPVGATLANSGVGNAVIVDDDSGPTVSISDVTKAEGDSGTTPFVFTVTLSKANSSAVTVAYNTVDGSATVGNNDYTAASGTVTFAAGVTSQVITVSVVGDKFAEPNETFSVVLSNPTGGVSLGDATGIGTIQSESTDDIANLPSSVSGQVFVDGNGDGTKSSSEKALSGIVVTLSGAASATTTTSAAGFYSFNGLDPGTYTVTFGSLGQYNAGSVFIGSQGGQTTANSYTFTIDAPGNMTGTGNNFTATGLKREFVSMRMMLASALGATNTSPSDLNVMISSVTDPITGNSAFDTTISGTGTAGAMVSVTASDGTNSTAALTTTVNANGNWTISGINVSSLADGEITYTATISDSGTTTEQDTITSTKDTAAPAVAIGSVTNPVNSSNVDDVSVSGTGEIGATINLVVSDGTDNVSGQATVNANGNWSVSGLDLSSLDDGTLTVTATATDTVGNVGTATMNVEKDTVAPTVAVTMVTPDPINADNEGSVTIDGTGQMGASISLTLSDSTTTTQTYTTTVDENGEWSIDGIDVSGLADETLTITVVATDAANNTTTITDTVVKDTTTTVTVDSITDPITSANEDSVMVSGTGEVGATIQVVAKDSADSTISGSTTVDANGDWTLTLDLTALLDGTIEFTVTATDTAGNTDQKTDSAEKLTETMVEITGLPATIGIGDDTSVPVSGTGNPGDTVEVVVTDENDHSTQAVMTTVDENGMWSLQVDVSALDDGTLTFKATATDSLNNTAEFSDTAEKSTLTVSPLVTINGANQAALPIGGTGEVGATVSITATDGNSTTEAVETTIQGDGTWSTTIDVSSLADGPITITVVATDVDTNSIQKQIEADKDTITELTLDAVPDPITSANVEMIEVSGVAEPGASVEVVVTDTATGMVSQTVMADGSTGQWSVTLDLSSLADGTIDFTVTSTDAVGNTAQQTDSAEKDTMTTVDFTELPSAIGIGDDASVTVSGTGEEGATIEVVVTDENDNSTQAVMTTVDENGEWTVQVDVSALDDGTLTFKATATDTLGNTAEVSDTVEKATLTVSPLVTINGANQAALPISGTGEVGAMVSITVTDGNSTTEAVETTIQGDGTWSAMLDLSSLPDGPITITVVATDVDTNSIQKEIEADKDTITELTLDAVPDPITSANVEMIEVSGVAEPGASVEVVVTDMGAGMVTQTVMADESTGQWSATLDLSMLLDGTIDFTVTSTDAVGNTDQKTDSAEKDTVTTVDFTELPAAIGIGDDASVTVSGTGEEGATIAVVVTDADDNSTQAVMTTVDGNGEWTLQVDVSQLNDGTLTFKATATDTLGNTAEVSDTVEKATLTVSPIANAINQDTDQAVPISGTGEAGATVSITATDGNTTTEAVETTILEDGTWSTTIDVSGLDDGEITFTVTATDVDTNMIEKMITADKDTVAEIFHDEIGPVNSENQSEFTITGTVEPGTILGVVATDEGSGMVDALATVEENGDWSITLNLSTLADGQITLTFSATDSLGNDSQLVVMIQKDTMAPDVTLDEQPLTIGPDNLDMYEVTGTVEPGATVQVEARDGSDNTVIGNANVDQDGNWTVTLDLTTLADGTITFTATAADEVGNTNTAQASTDKIAPAPLALTDSGDGDDMLSAVAAALAASEDDPGAIDQALSMESDWTLYED